MGIHELERRPAHAHGKGGAEVHVAAVVRPAAGSHVSINSHIRSATCVNRLPHTREVRSQAALRLGVKSAIRADLERGDREDVG